MGLHKVIVITIIISFLSNTESTCLPFSCDTSNPDTIKLQFCNSSLLVDQRVDDLILRLNLDEKISQLGNTAPAIPRLNIPAYEWWSEALHGLSMEGLGVKFNGSIEAATQFPQIILTASTFDEHLWYHIAQAISREARAVYNAGELKGMTFWAPNVNILRDPRWGRAQETAGEDPMMVGKYAVAYVRGLQGDSFEDCDAIRVMRDSRGYTAEDAVAASLKAGMDVNCGSFVANYTRLALEKQKLQESDIDRALRNIFSIRMRLGLFNGDPKQLEYGDISPAEICSQEHQDLSLEAAKNGIVLLKNSAKRLPLSKIKTISLAIIGPKANDSKLLLGNYAGIPCRNVSLLQGFQGVVKNIGYHPGCNFVNCTSAAIDEAVDVAKKAQYVVLIMGLDQQVERENWDRVDLGLPGQQEILINAVAEAAVEPVILVLVSGGPIDISFAKNHPKIGGILWIGYPGEGGAAALTQILFGEHNPGGRLPVTWYPKDFIKVPMTDMNMRPNSSTGYPGRTYKFYKGPKVYEFGYGLSYTNYSYNITSVSHDKLYFINQTSSDKRRKHGSHIHNIAVSKFGSEVCNKAKISVKVVVRNKGKIGGKHPVLLFVRHSKVKDDEVPRKQLIGFKSVHLGAREKSKIKFIVSPCEHFSRANKHGISVIDEGKYYLVVGDEKYPVTVSI
ncbi:hypothetical protein RDI58_011500 [Solanum bulbocastanum]|uniref:Fibronectin type III-like domain-containing protein n=1 Tax=Solanum bulbocastanum TaxID=147425 RepID=A0AAN8TRH5_SOLBU